MSKVVYYPKNEEEIQEFIDSLASFELNYIFVIANQKTILNTMKELRKRYIIEKSNIGTMRFHIDTSLKEEDFVIIKKGHKLYESTLKSYEEKEDAWITI